MIIGIDKGPRSDLEPMAIRTVSVCALTDIKEMKLKIFLWCFVMFSRRKIKNQDFNFCDMMNSIEKRMNSWVVDEYLRS